MNTKFLSAGIQFYLAGSTPNFINNSAYYTVDLASNYNTLLSTYRDATAINLFIVNSITQSNVEYGGFGGDNVLITTASLTPAALTHEFGHHFGLLHTFGGGQELVSGANCTKAADLICDTPADPWDLAGGGNTDDGSCTYRGSLTDAQGRPYQPMMDNVMSGWQCSRSAAARFTAGQQQAMSTNLAYWLQNPNPNRTYTYPPNAVTAPTLVSVTKINGQVRLLWQENSTNEAGFFIERAVGSPDNFSAIGGVVPNVTTFTDAGINSSTTYFYRIRPTNTATNALSNVVTFNAGPLYCSPRYFAPYPASGGNVGIDDVILKTAANTVLLSNTASGFAPGSYIDYSSSIAPVTLTAGQTYTLTLKGKFDGLNQAKIAVWIDYNADGVFSATERVVAPGDKLLAGASLTASFTVPATVTPGPTAMRVRNASLIPPDPTDVADPCAFLYGKGEAEDYAITLQGAPSVSLAVGTISTACVGSPLTIPFSTTGPFGNGNAFTVQLSDATGTNFTTIPSSGTSSPLTATIPRNIPAGSNYRIRILASSPALISGTSNAFTINLPAIASLAGNATITSGQSVPLGLALDGSGPWNVTLTSNTGENYTFATPLDEFNLYVAPRQTTTYQIVQVSNACGLGSATGQVLITVRQACSAPTANLSGSTTITAGQKATLTVAFTGSAPYTFTTSTGQVFTNISQNPYSFSVSPAQTTVYTLTQVSNVCGTGTTSGAATVTLNSACPGLAAYMTGNTIINSGQSTPLEISLGGSGPWSLTLAASTGENYAFSIPISRFYLYVAPSQTTTYQITDIQTACGEGIPSGTVTVTVRNPNGRISAPVTPLYYVSEIRLSDAARRTLEQSGTASNVEKSFVAYPNPTAGALTVQYQSTDEGPVQLQVVDLAGKVVKVLLDKSVSQIGAYTEQFQLTELPAGPYLLVLKRRQGVTTQKILLIR